MDGRHCYAAESVVERLDVVDQVAGCYENSWVAATGREGLAFIEVEAEDGHSAEGCVEAFVVCLPVRMGSEEWICVGETYQLLLEVPSHPPGLRSCEE